MSFDDLLIAMIIAGIGLSGAFLCAKFCEWRSCVDAEKRQATGFREVFAHHLRLEEWDIRASRGGGQQKIVDTNSTMIPGVIAEANVCSSTYEPYKRENSHDTF